MKGKLIAFEGIDGSGKSTQFLRIFAWLKEQGYLTAGSLEPNDQSNLSGRLIRNMLSDDVPMIENPVEFQRLYVIDRAQDFFCYIRPFLQEDSERLYLMDRFCMSTIAYGMLYNQSADYFIELHKQVIGPLFVWPHLNIVVDMPANKAMTRVERRFKKIKKSDFFEQEQKLEKIRMNYLALAKHDLFRDNTVVINGDQLESEVFEDIKRVLLPILPVEN